MAGLIFHSHLQRSISVLLLAAFVLLSVVPAGAREATLRTPMSQSMSRTEAPQPAASALDAAFEAYKLHLIDRARREAIREVILVNIPSLRLNERHAARPCTAAYPCNEYKQRLRRFRPISSNM